MSSKKFHPFKDFQSDQIQRSSRKIFTAHYSCRNTDLNLTLVSETTNAFIFQKINSLIESCGVRLTGLDCNRFAEVKDLGPFSRKFRLIYEPENKYSDHQRKTRLYFVLLTVGFTILSAKLSQPPNLLS